MPRFLFSSSCSLYGAGGDEPARRERRVQPGDAPTASRRCASSRRSPSSPTTAFSPGLPAQRHRLRRVAAAARRHRRQQPGRPRRHDAARSCCRATARPGVRWSTSATSSTRSSPCLTAPAEAIHNQAFNVGRIERELPHPRGRRDGRGGRPGLRGDVRARAPRPTRATTGSTSRKIETQAARLQADAGPCARASRSCTRRTRRTRCRSPSGTVRATTGSRPSSAFKRAALSTPTCAGWASLDRLRVDSIGSRSRIRTSVGAQTSGRPGGASRCVRSAR